MKRLLIKFIIIYITLFYSFISNDALCAENHPPRTTWESEHFLITIDSKKKKRLPNVVNLIEHCFDKFSYFYEFKQQNKIKLFLLDEDDFSNGAAFSPGEWVLVYLPKIDFKLRGNAIWLEGVVSHELAHIFSLRKMGVTSKYMGLSIQIAAAKNRGDSAKMAIVIPSKEVPAWLAEGLAQYGAYYLGYDAFDSHRRMTLKHAIIADELLSLKEMEVFAGDKRQNEMVYTQGFSLVKYMYENFDKYKMNLFLEKVAIIGWEKACLKEFNIAIEELYYKWKKSITSELVENENPKKFLFKELTTSDSNLFISQFSPVQTKNGNIYYISSENNDYGITSLYKLNKNGESTIIERNVIGSLKISPDKMKILYIKEEFLFTKKVWRNILYELIFDNNGDIKSNEQVIYSPESRVRSAAYGRDDKIYLLSEDQGLSKLYSIRIENKNEITTNYIPKLTKIYSSPDNIDLLDIQTDCQDTTLLIEATSGIGSDIYRFNLKENYLLPILQNKADERDAICINNSVIFAADYANSFQLYQLKNDKLKQLTNSENSFFEPWTDGIDLITSIYNQKGFLLHKQQFTQTIAKAIDLNKENINIRSHNPIQKSTFTSLGKDLSQNEVIGFSISLNFEYFSPHELTLMDLNNNEKIDVQMSSWFESGLSFSGLYYHPTGKSISGVQMTVGFLNPTGKTYANNGFKTSNNFSFQFASVYDGFLPELAFLLDFKQQKLPYGINKVNNRLYSLSLTKFNISGSMSFRLNRYWSNVTLGTLTLDLIHDFEREAGSGGGLIGLIEAFNYSLINPGVDLILSGFQTTFGAILALAPNEKDNSDLTIKPLPFINITANNNLLRKIFLQGNVNLYLNNENEIDLFYFGNLGITIPFPIKFKTKGTFLAITKGFFSLKAGYGTHNNTEYLSESNFSKSFIPELSLVPKIPSFILNDNNNYFISKYNTHLDIMLRFKVISIYSTLTFWKFIVTYPVNLDEKGMKIIKFNNPVFGLLFSI